jgi:predicted ArsR family transcriptional regulator
MEINEKILDELISIRKMLTILSQDKLLDFNEQIKNKYLTTEQRQKMYDLFDGTKSLKDIGEEVNTSSEAVRLFAVSLEKAGLIEYVIESKVKCPKRLF